MFIHLFSDGELVQFSSGVATTEEVEDRTVDFFDPENKTKIDDHIFEYLKKM